MTAPGARRPLLLIAAAVIVVGAIAAWVALDAATRLPSYVHALSAASLGNRVLVIATHPDDEVLATSGTIQQLLAAGARVRVVIVTAGDGFPGSAARLTPGPVTPESMRHLGEVRRSESLAAAKVLGLAPEDIVALGFPDAGTAALWSEDWSASSPLRSRAGVDRVPYEWAAAPGAPYTGSELATELVGIIEAFEPDTVISPDARETHTDHHSVAAFTLYALAASGFQGRHLTTLVHYKDYPSAQAYAPGGVLLPPAGLAESDTSWLSVPLTDAERADRKTALDAYASQSWLRHLELYVQALARSNDLFAGRPPGIPELQPTDATPTAAASGTIDVTPPPTGDVVYAPESRIASVRMVRGPKTTWVGVTTAGPVDPAYRYEISMRLVSRDRTARLDVASADGTATVGRVSDDALRPKVTSLATSDTVWFALPSATLDAYTRAIVRASAGPTGTPPYRTPWREVAL